MLALAPFSEASSKFNDAAKQAVFMRLAHAGASAVGAVAPCDRLRPALQDRGLELGSLVSGLQQQNERFLPEEQY